MVVGSSGTSWVWGSALVVASVGIAGAFWAVVRSGDKPVPERRGTQRDLEASFARSEIDREESDRRRLVFQHP